MNYVRIIDKKPSVWLAHRFYVIEQFDLCLNVVDQTLRKNPDNPEALNLKGCVLRTKGKIDEALGCFQSAAFMDSNNIRHQIELIKCLFLLGRYNQSLSMLKNLESTRGGNTWEVHHLIGQCEYRLNRLGDAIDSFQNALDADERIETILELFDVYEKLSDKQSIEALIKESLVKHSTNASLHYKIGRYFVSQNQLNDAFPKFSFSFDKDNLNFLAALFCGAIIQVNTDVTRSMNYYRQAFIGVPRSTALWNNVGLCLYRNNKIDSTVACCKKITSVTPFDAIPFANLGLTFLNMKMFCSAAIFLRKAYSLNPNLGSVSEGLAIALMNLGKFDAALHLFQFDLKNDFDWRLVINAAICYVLSNQYAKGLELYQRLMESEHALEVDPLLKGDIDQLFTAQPKITQQKKK